MAKKDYTHPHLLEIKTLAKQLQSDAKQSGSNLVYGHALDLASVQYGYKDWNTACGMLNSTPIVKAQPLEEIVNTQKKIFYVKSNPLMSEHQNIIDSPNSEAVPEEYCESIESIDAYVREKGGSLFFPVNSVADLVNMSEETKKALESNIDTKILLSRTGQIAQYDFSSNENHNIPFVIGRSGVGQSVYIEDVMEDTRKEGMEGKMSEITIINKHFPKSEYYEGLTPHPNRSEAIDIDDLFEAMGGTWRIHNPRNKRKFVYGNKTVKNKNYGLHSYFEYFDEKRGVRIRYEHLFGDKHVDEFGEERDSRSLCTVYSKPEMRFNVSDDEFWDQYAEQIEKRNITFEDIERKLPN